MRTRKFLNLTVWLIKLTIMSLNNGHAGKGRPRSALAAQIAKALEMKSSLFADPLLPLAEARAALGVSDSTIRKLIGSGKLRAWRNSPRGHWRISCSEIKKYLDSGFAQAGVQQ
jgi:excisionase family DNA binding protein